MRSIFPSLRPGLTLSFRAALMLFAVGMFNACDRHPATEVPENYGHGSSHERTVTDHQPDSRGQEHFSDTAGTKDEVAGEPRHAPAASPTPTPTPRF